MANEYGQYTDCYEATELLILGTDQVWEENSVSEFVDLLNPTKWDEMAMAFWDLSFLGANFMFKCRYPNWIKQAEYLTTLEGIERFGVRIIFASFTSIPDIVYIQDNANDTFDYGIGWGRWISLFLNFDL